MRFVNFLAGAVMAAAAVASLSAPLGASTAGVEALVRRRMPEQAGQFRFAVVNASEAAVKDRLKTKAVDNFVVSSETGGRICIEGNSTSALLSGLHRYLADVVHLDIWWFIGSQLDKAPTTLPNVSEPIRGTSIVPFRYYFNTVTTSYTSVFWGWEEWELQLDWMALRGINLPLAWIGAEQIFIDVFREVGFTDAEILSFLSGPAFLAWNHFGNIQGSWGGALPLAWAQAQQDLQKKIVVRMLELGMIPILPAFPGFVPRAVSRLYPEAKVVNGSNWAEFPDKYSNDTFLDPLDPLFADLQKRFIAKQQQVYGDISNFYALDQYNEIDPLSGELDYLKNISLNTWKTLKSADEDAIWVMQGWLFTSSPEFWTDNRTEAFLSGVPVDTDMLVLDLFSESEPQWQRTNSYYGKPWVWCQLHDYGGNMGLYGQIMNITADPINALHNSSSLIGFGLSMEGQEGNEIVYNLLLDQAWSPDAIDTKAYFHDWVTTRYGLTGAIKNGPAFAGLYGAWEMVRTTVYNNVKLAANAVPKSIMELVPSKSGLLDRTGHHPTILNYDPKIVVAAWKEMYRVGRADPTFMDNAAYTHDLVDFSRQVFANAFIPKYELLIETYEDVSLDPNTRNKSIQSIGRTMVALMTSMDRVLGTSPQFRLSTWIKAARAAATDSGMADFFEYEARNQVTLWGPGGEITDYASKSWAGLISSYYVPRWQMFIDYLLCTEPVAYDQTVFDAMLLEWELEWCERKGAVDDVTDESLARVMAETVSEWGDVFDGVIRFYDDQDGRVKGIASLETPMDRSRL